MNERNLLYCYFKIITKFHIIILICNIKTMNNHSSDQGELDEAFNCDHESRQIDDNLQMEDDKQRPQHQRRIIIEKITVD